MYNSKLLTFIVKNSIEEESEKKHDDHGNGKSSKFDFRKIKELLLAKITAIPASVRIFN